MLKRYLSMFIALAAGTAFALSPAPADAASHHSGGHAVHSSGHVVHSGGHAVHSSGHAVHSGGRVVHSGGRGAWHGSGGGRAWHGGGRYYGNRGFYGYGLGFGYPYSNYGYGYYPDSSDYGAYYDNYPSYVPPDDYYDNGPTYDVMPPEDYGAITTPAPAQDNAAHIHVIVPENARVWFNGAPTSQTGGDREFQSPALTLGRDFTYEIKASSLGPDGKEVTRTRQVDVRANSDITVDFTRAI